MGKRKAQYVIQERNGKRSWYCRHTAIGPMFTTKLSEAAAFATKDEAIPVCQSHWIAFALCEVREVEQCRRKRGGERGQAT